MTETNLPKQLYLVKNKDLSVRMASRSGGIFSIISDYVLARNGVVYGCVLTENNRVVHLRGQNSYDRNLMRQSKYTQSRPGESFKNVVDDLETGKYVLFTGTGCQVAGLLSFLNAKKVSTEKLITMDIICHGVVSPKIFEDYIAWLEEKYKGKVENFLFRDKTQDGWEGYTETCTINGKEIHSPVYKLIFNSALALRPSCYECPYTKVQRDSDFTIGDAWGIKKAADHFNDNRGVSLVIAHNDKGRDIIEKIKADIEMIEVPIQPMLQKNLRMPTNKPMNRDEFWTCYYEKGFSGVAAQYGKETIKKKLYKWVKYKMKQVVQGRKYYLP